MSRRYSYLDAEKGPAAFVGLAGNRDSLGAPGGERSCPEETALFNILVACEGYRCSLVCRCVRTPCMVGEESSWSVNLILLTWIFSM